MRGVPESHRLSTSRANRKREQVDAKHAFNRIRTRTRTRT